MCKICRGESRIVINMVDDGGMGKTLRKTYDIIATILGRKRCTRIITVREICDASGMQSPTPSPNLKRTKRGPEETIIVFAMDGESFVGFNMNLDEERQEFLTLTAEAYRLERTKRMERTQRIVCKKCLCRSCMRHQLQLQ